MVGLGRGLEGLQTAEGGQRQAPAHTPPPELEKRTRPHPKDLGAAWPRTPRQELPAHLHQPHSMPMAHRRGA